MLLGAKHRVERAPVRGDPARVAAIGAWLEMLRWNHELHFGRADDPRDAIVRGPIDDLNRFQRILARSVRSAKLDDGADVRLVRGPFAVGMLRVAGVAATAAPEPVPEDELEVTQVAPQTRPKFHPPRITARHAPSGVTVSLTGYPEHALEILRVLVADQLSCASRK